jgi:hypothetical protein
MLHPKRGDAPTSAHFVTTAAGSSPNVEAPTGLEPFSQTHPAWAVGSLRRAGTCRSQPRMAGT